MDKPAEPDAEPLKPEDEETQEVQGQEVSYALLLPLEAIRLHLRHHEPCGLSHGGSTLYSACCRADGRLVWLRHGWSVVPDFLCNTCCPDIS